MFDDTLCQGADDRRIDIGHQLGQHGLVHQLPVGVVGVDLTPKRCFGVAEMRFVMGGHGTRGCSTLTLSAPEGDSRTMVR